VAPFEFPTGGGKRFPEIRLQGLLRRPADPIGLLAKIAIGDEHGSVFACGLG
jgi:hypothetical protein